MLYQENFKKTADYIEKVSDKVIENISLSEVSDTSLVTTYLSSIFAMLSNIARSLAILADEAVAERKERETKADEVIKNLLEVDHERDGREKL